MTTPTPTGTVAIDGQHATLSYERRLPHPIEVVWAALTDPDQRSAWFGSTVIDPREGGMIETVSEGPPAPRERRRITGRIRVWDPPHVLEHEWNQQGVSESVVRYELTPDGQQTLLTFVHRGLRAQDARGYAPGGHAFLDRLGAFLDAAEMPDWQERYTTVQHAYA